VSTECPVHPQLADKSWVDISVQKFVDVVPSIKTQMIKIDEAFGDVVVSSLCFQGCYCIATDKLIPSKVVFVVTSLFSLFLPLLLDVETFVP
jgi:hypothetical protein